MCADVRYEKERMFTVNDVGKRLLELADGAVSLDAIGYTDFHRFFLQRRYFLLKICENLCNLRSRLPSSPLSVVASVAVVKRPPQMLRTPLSPGQAHIEQTAFE